MRNTVAPDHGIVDRVACRRDPAPCGTVIGPEWAACSPADATCQQLAGRAFAAAATPPRRSLGVELGGTAAAHGTGRAPGAGKR